MNEQKWFDVWSKLPVNYEDDEESKARLLRVNPCNSAHPGD